MKDNFSLLDRHFIVPLNKGLPFNQVTCMQEFIQYFVLIYTQDSVAPKFHISNTY
jgi:hypothetical protein